MQTHHLDVPLRDGVKSKAFWASEPGGTAIVFVHGFGGSAIETWLRFPSMLMQSEKCADVDLLFYGYDSLRKRATASGAALYKFLRKLNDQPNTVLHQSLPSVTRPADFRYSKVLLVAHSLGAVVSRLALISAHGNGDKWPHHTQLILFAPAHKGANILELAILALSVIRCFPTEAVARWRFPSLSDLKEDCQTLRYLDSKVQAEVAAGADYLRATAIIHADNDSIVTPLDLIVDPPASFYEQSHTGVCKPGLMFDSPIDEVIRHL